MSPRRPLTTWFAAMLAADVALAVVAAALLVAQSRGLVGRPGSVAPATLRALAAASLPVGGGAAAWARRLWRREAENAALALAMLPMVAGVPYVFATLGLPL